MTLFQTEHIREHVGFLSRLVAAALQLANGATPQAAARWRQLQRDASGFETLMTTFLTVADNCELIVVGVKLSPFVFLG